MCCTYIVGTYVCMYVVVAFVVVAVVAVVVVVPLAAAVVITLAVVAGTYSINTYIHTVACIVLSRTKVERCVCGVWCCIFVRACRSAVALGAAASSVVDVVITDRRVLLSNRVRFRHAKNFSGNQKMY